MLTLSLHSFASNIHAIPFVKKSGLIIIEASIDGRSGSFIFDTGADGLYLNTDINNSEKTIEIETVNGITLANTLKIEELKLGTLSLTSVDAFGLDLKNIENLVDRPILGIIGARLMDSEIIRIDNVSHRLFIIPRKSLREELLSKSLQCDFELENELPIVAVKINNAEYKFILDTGSTSSTIDKDFLNQNHDQFINLEKVVSLLTSSGQSDARSYKLKPFYLSNLTIKEMEFVAVDLTTVQSNFDADIKGIIAIDKLPYKEIYLDFKKKKLHFLF